MPLTPENTRHFFEHLYAGELQTVTLLKRNPDQQQGVVRSVTLFNVRMHQIHKTGETIQDSMSAGDRTVFSIPAASLNAAGVEYISQLDRIVDGRGRVWEPEAPQDITIKLFENVFRVTCTRLK